VGRSYCRSCSVKREQERRKNSPWLKLYHLPEWNRVKWHVHKRDGYRCTYADRLGRRCRATTKTSTMEAHHVVKVRELYRLAKGDWHKFLALALDPDNICSLCWRHHLYADKPVGKPGSLVSAKLSSGPKKRRRARQTKKATRDRRRW
jgi:hypothetical protein